MRRPQNYFKMFVAFTEYLNFNLNIKGRNFRRTGFPADCHIMVHKLEVLGFTKAVLLEVFPMSPDDAEEDESSKMFFDTQHCKIDLKNTKHTTTVWITGPW